VIGRNQNPWVETNLSLLRQGVPHAEYAESNQSVLLVRRRSGGGTVFHDEGNVNWTVVCPSADFDRNRHAEMVVRALRRLGVGDGIRVNCRHDIVVGGQEQANAGEDACGNDTGTVYKVSGSAYKLTRLRSLHHGTCLLSSPNLGRISDLLRSPAEAYIKARGVESVRSKIRNVHVDHQDFVSSVTDEFRGMYGGEDVETTSVGRTALELPEVMEGFKELQVGSSLDTPSVLYGR
jgi:lipoate-protein ligase A